MGFPVAATISPFRQACPVAPQPPGRVDRRARRWLPACLLLLAMLAPPAATAHGVQLEHDALIAIAGCAASSVEVAAKPGWTLQPDLTPIQVRSSIDVAITSWTLLPDLTPVPLPLCR